MQTRNLRLRLFKTKCIFFLMDKSLKTQEIGYDKGYVE